jgi:hypothetical protein
MINLCAPAIIYLIFSLTQILIDLYQGLFNTAMMKVIVMIMVTFLLNILCQQNLGIVSWIIVFIPFILMTVIVSMLLYVFGLDAATGKINNSSSNNGITTDSSGNVIIYDPNYTPYNPVHYNSPNIIVPNPNPNNLQPPTQQQIPSVQQQNTYQTFPQGTSSPAYVS